MVIPCYARGGLDARSLTDSLVLFDVFGLLAVRSLSNSQISYLHLPLNWGRLILVLTFSDYNDADVFGLLNNSQNQVRTQQTAPGTILRPA